MFANDPGLDFSSMDLDAVTIADQPRRPYRTPLWRGGDEPVCDWTQSTDSVTIFLPLEHRGPSTRPAVKFMAQRLRVATRGGPGGGSVLLEGELGGRVDPDECEWRVERGELVIVLRKEKHREWAVPLKPSVPAAPEATGAGGGSSSPSAAAAVSSASRAVRPGPPPPKPLSAGEAAAAAPTKKGGLSSNYADWDRFDQEAALMELENEGKPDEPNMELRSGGKGGAVGIQCTDYKKDKEEVALDEEIAVKREQLQATLNGRLESAADLKRRGNALLAKAPSDARGALALYLDGVDALEVLHATATPILSDRLAETVRCLRRDLHSNAAQACLALHEWHEAAALATAALEAEPNLPKALYRRAAALVAMEGDEASAAQARADLEDLIRQQPRNGAALKLLQSPFLASAAAVAAAGTGAAAAEADGVKTDAHAAAMGKAAAVAEEALVEAEAAVVRPA